MNVNDNPEFWTDLAAFNKTLTPFTTTNLRTLCTNRGWATGVTPVEFNRKCGKAFEETALKFFGLPENRTNYDAPERARKNSPNPPTKVRPDARTNAMFITKDNTKGTNIYQLPGYLVTEVKAHAGTLTLSSNNWQMLGELEIMTKARNDVKNNVQIPVKPASPPVLFLITTDDTKIDQSIIDEAYKRELWIWVSKSVYDPATGKISFTTPTWLLGGLRGSTVTTDLIMDLIPGSDILNKNSTLLTPATPNFDVDPETLE